ncbi:hypothetical protein NHL53_08325 [Microbacterium sp. gxy059]
MPESMEDCVIEHPGDALDGSACVLDPERATTPVDSQFEAAEIESRAHVVSRTDFYCDDDGCPMVIGNAIVYRDAHHMSAPFLRTLWSYFYERATEAVPALAEGRG